MSGIKYNKKRSFKEEDIKQISDETKADITKSQERKLEVAKMTKLQWMCRICKM